MDLIFYSRTTSHRKFYLYILKNILISSIIFFSITLIYKQFFSHIADFTPVSFGTWLLSLIKILKKDKVESVIVNNEKQHIIVNYWRFFVGKDQLQISFEELYFKSVKSFFLKENILKIGRKESEIIEINNSKDNFSDDIIHELGKAVSENQSFSI